MEEKTMSFSDILPIVVIYITLLVIRFIGYTITFSRYHAAKLSSRVLILFVAGIGVAGILLDVTFFFGIQGELPAYIQTPPFYIVIAAMAEAITGYSGYSIAKRASKIIDQEETITARYVCDDGHVVKSRGEALLDNWLAKQGLPHDYEKTITLGSEKIKYDWYLPDADVYVEYWGLATRDYKKRREEKEKLYNKYQKKLVGIMNVDLEDINAKVKAKLLKYLDESDFDKPRRCFNCGAALDERYS
nr:hypothetical protein [Candidatus Sigynarchaeota archaeon]